MSKWLLKNKNKKHYFDAFSSEKYFEKQPQSHSQTDRETNKECKKKITIVYKIICPQIWLAKHHDLWWSHPILWY
jgi:hypothetical protein